MKQSTFEYLLKQKEMDGKLEPIKDSIPIKKAPKQLQATDDASLDDLFIMIGEIVSRSMKKDNVIFNPDEGARFQKDLELKIESPYIFFSVLSCVPKDELKPRVRREILEKVEDINNEFNTRKGRVFGQKFKAVVQFDIFAPDYLLANKTMNNFENLIYNYTGHFKKKGIAELIFQGRFTDRNLDEYRENCSIRSLKYYVEIEKNYVVYDNIFMITDIGV